MKATSQDPRILLVDDNTVVRDMLVDLVASLGYRADAAASGQEALELFDRGQYSLVLTDLLMPLSVSSTLFRCPEMPKSSYLNEASVPWPRWALA